jgi:DNA-binding transcriptional LysR family regulator
MLPLGERNGRPVVAQVRPSVLAAAARRVQYFRRVEPSIETRQLRYFVTVAEELHFGRAAERLHMSQSPLSRAIRELEQDLGLVLFVRTTRRVELTAAGWVLLERSRRALAEIDGAIADARKASLPEDGVLALGYGPFSRPVAVAIADELGRRDGDRGVRLEEDVTPEMLRQVARHALALAGHRRMPLGRRLIPTIAVPSAAF